MLPQSKQSKEGIHSFSLYLGIAKTYFEFYLRLAKKNHIISIFIWYSNYIEDLHERNPEDLTMAMKNSKVDFCWILGSTN